MIATGIFIAATAIIVVDFTNVCRVDAVELNGNAIGDWNDRFPMLNNKSITRQPVAKLVRAALANDTTVTVTASYAWPHTLKVTTNDIIPDCLMLCAKTGKMVGVDSEGRFIPLAGRQTDWERPALTGIAAGKAYEPCRDDRVRPIVRELNDLLRRNPDLYRLIDEVDMHRSEYVTVSIDGLPYKLRACADRLSEDIDKFVEFVARFQPDLNEIKTLDLRFDDMIICSERNN
jgi:hypothetical protein